MAIRILYICTHCPLAETYGAQLRTLQTARLLQRVGSVSMVLASGAEWSQNELARTAAEFDLKVVARFSADPLNSVGERLRRELDPNFVNAFGVAVSPETVRQVESIIGDFDVTWIHTLQVAHAFRRLRWLHSVLDIDDLPSSYWQNVARVSHSPWRKLTAARLVWQWRRRERRLLKRFTEVTVCSAADRAYFGNDSRIHVIPNGFPPVPMRKTLDEPHEPRLGLIGHFGYPPNMDGLRWFLGKVWPLIRRDVPGVHLHLIGKGSAGNHLDGIEGVRAFGFVEDPSDEIGTWSGMIVPLRIGAGTRVKIAEAFARGCPVISTSLGAYGYDVRNGREILIADRPVEFAEACIRILTDRLLRENVAHNALEYFSGQLSWEAIEPAVRRVVHACIEHAGIDHRQDRASFEYARGNR